MVIPELVMVSSINRSDKLPPVVVERLYVSGSNVIYFVTFNAGRDLVERLKPFYPSAEWCKSNRGTHFQLDDRDAVLFEIAHSGASA